MCMPGERFYDNTPHVLLPVKVWARQRGRSVTMSQSQGWQTRKTPSKARSEESNDENFSVYQRMPTHTRIRSQRMNPNRHIRTHELSHRLALHGRFLKARRDVRPNAP